MPMFTRSLAVPERSFFLLGPRGTGKTTWLRQALPDALVFNLLLERELVRLSRGTGTFRAEVEALPAGSWVVIDEVQRHPALLDEVHDLLTTHPRRYRFALSGSSARKLRRADANQLAGRALSRTFFPLTAAELGEAVPTDDLLRFGTLPLICTEPSEATRTDLLEAYVETYLTQEIRAEALVRQLAPFTRFLEVAGLANGQVTNLASLARDAGVARPTVQGFVEVLVDTLVATLLPPWRPRARVKEVGHPKLYFFDPGVARAVSGRGRVPLDGAERGPLLETYVLHELRAHTSYRALGGELSYWRTPSGVEVDFVWQRAGKAIGIEVKASDRWRTGDGDALATLLAEKRIDRGFGVYLGARPQADRGIRVLPLTGFLTALARGEILPAR